MLMVVMMIVSVRSQNGDCQLKVEVVFVNVVWLRWW